MANPLDSHWVVVKRILRYLKGTIFHGLFIQPGSISKPMARYAFCDADWASDVDDRRSTSVLKLNIVAWLKPLLN